MNTIEKMKSMLLETQKEATKINQEHDYKIRLGGAPYIALIRLESRIQTLLEVLNLLETGYAK